MTITATVTPAKASYIPLQGAVDFYANGIFLDTVEVVDGKASLTYQFDEIASEDVYAVFIPTTNYLRSISLPRRLPVKAPNVIDVLALYTPEMLSFAGIGQEIMSQFLAQIDQANEAFINSEIPIVLKMVSLAPTSYEESGSLSLDLRRLYTSGDGFMDDALVLRNQLRADLVVLLDSSGTQTGDTLTEGISTQLQNPKDPFRSAHAYIVLDQAAPFEDFVFAHEVGHTLGATHAVGDPQATGAAPYAHGYRFTGDDGYLYHDIMAYEPGETIPYFSNPAITYAGVPLGNTSSANAARVIRENARLVAAYRTAGPVGTIDAFTPASVTGLALDPYATDQMYIRIDIDNHIGDAFLTDTTREDLTDRFGTPVYTFDYDLPSLEKGFHILKILSIDPATDTAVLIARRSFHVTAPLFDARYYSADKLTADDHVQSRQFSSASDPFIKMSQDQRLDPSSCFHTIHFLANKSKTGNEPQSRTINSPLRYFPGISERLFLKTSAYFDEKYDQAACAAIRKLVRNGTLHSGLEQFPINTVPAGNIPLP